MRSIVLPLRVINRVTKAFEIPDREGAPLKSKTYKTAQVCAVVMSVEQEYVTGRPLEHTVRTG